MPDLPPELWCTVALYLPNDTLKGLYAVNRPFFDLAMNESYREVSFRKIDESTTRQLEALSSLSGSLEHLTVSCCPPEYLSVFYKHKSLSSLTLNVASLGRQSFETSTSSGLHGFLRQQGGTLRHLEISASVSENPWRAYRFSFHDLQLSSLQSLSVTADILASSWDDSFAFLRNHVQLESLSIDGPLAPSEIYRILDVLNHHHPSTALVELSLSIYNLDVRVLDKLASDLRRLRSLKLKISKISCDTTYAITPSQHFPDDSVSGKVYPFVNEMKLHASFERWELKDITIKRRSCCADLLLWGLMSLCAQCIPSITSFAGNGDKMIPAGLQLQATYKRCLQVLCSYGTDHTLW
ncbi:unnamed protein product [Cyclocybe aegerita]|uniref:F-box domain-containing protein n=1 Tax=Cyclocybe aegerita TaxID=1973307 RepID=A0A8S0WFX0_CYCAE|nr:unnamed protein product [Cyclocybe aegerita]